MNAAMEDKESVAPKANVALEKRVYIGGLPRSMTADDLQNRFKMFGEISDASIAKDTENQCRGFGYITIQTTTNQWTKCLSVYNNAKWKGGVMKIEDAKPEYKEKLEAEKQALRLKQEKKEERASKRRRNTDADGFIARDMTLVNDKNVDGRKGWKRGRYGRAIAVMRLQKDNGTKASSFADKAIAYQLPNLIYIYSFQFVFDPSHYKNNLLKLYDIKVRMKPTRSLPMFYEDIDDTIESYDHASDHDDNYAMQEDSENEDEAVQITTKSPVLPPKLTKEQVNEKRLQTLEQREMERHEEKERIAAMLAQVESGKRKDGHITFGDDDEKAPKNIEHDNDSDDVVEQHQSKDAMKWMFDSDESDDDDTPALNINPVMEGEKGRERLELQRTFGGDERFKLGADFMDDDSDEEESWNQAKQEDNLARDEIAAELNQEKSTSLDVLKAMFGEDNRTVLREAPKSAGWTPGLRFDPDEEDADLLVDTTQPEESQNKEAELAQQQKEVLPEVSSDKHFQVNINLKPLFTPGAQETPFKLFGGDSETEEEEEEPEEIEDEDSCRTHPSFSSILEIKSYPNDQPIKTTVYLCARTQWRKSLLLGSLSAKN
ncbi:hypothetical protein K450DRAFT_224414 [Umbelopsis ramanniana AG]|uniref:RRM domain-containing protein n=1 Tax=Umbelopsis ramanniana AG TaxID=1314678 RepID=A0AAD5HG50_UMBRA|nr:uncharacterized protein K450DRAFT_224414 [Umbelopsis ramanniana AG]KAI8583142.1 hypothetical protein K450DRAFT_224414 [Umbelopsis ramanniana AG]